MSLDAAARKLARHPVYEAVPDAALLFLFHNRNAG